MDEETKIISFVFYKSDSYKNAQYNQFTLPAMELAFYQPQICFST